MIVSCGDAVIDFLPRLTREGALAFQPFAGGSVHNTAIALARLGVRTGFFDGLSTDFFGDMIRASLDASGVDLRYVLTSNRPTPLAFVQFSPDGHARYVFQDEGTAGRLITAADIPDFSPEVTTLHTGSIRLVNEPCGAAFVTMVQRFASRMVISLDPNIRPAVVADRAGFTQRIMGLAAMADMVKLSDEDAAWLAPGKTDIALARTLLASGTRLVVITRGARGATALTAHMQVECAPVEVEVADTVGAGDTFTAGLLASFRQAGVLNKAAMAHLSHGVLENALAFAARAAAITVSRPGADPPWASDITAWQAGRRFPASGEP